MRVRLLTTGKKQKIKIYDMVLLCDFTLALNSKSEFLFSVHTFSRLPLSEETCNY
jgi:hypothetical protein